MFSYLDVRLRGALYAVIYLAAGDILCSQPCASRPDKGSPIVGKRHFTSDNSPAWRLCRLLATGTTARLFAVLEVSTPAAASAETRV